MNQLLKYQMAKNIKKWFVVSIITLIAVVTPIFKLNPFSINIIIMVAILSRSNYFGYLLEDHYYKQLLASPIRSKELYKISYLVGVLTVILFFFTSLCLSVWQAWKLDQFMFLESYSPITEAILVSVWFTCVIIVMIGYFIYYTFKDGLRDKFADEMLLLFGCMILYGVPLLLFFLLVSMAWIWLGAIFALIISFTIYYRMYVKTVKNVPSLVAKLELDYKID